MSHFLIDGRGSQSSDSWKFISDGMVVADNVNLSGVGGALSVINAILVATLAGALEWVHRSEVAEGPTEDSCLKLQDDTHEEVDPKPVRLLAVGGSVAVLAFATIEGWISQQIAPIAVAAIGLSLLFTLRPVVFRCDRAWANTMSLNMATAPWLCIAWQLVFGVMPIHVLTVGIQGESGSKILPWTMLVTFVGAVYLCTSLEVTGGPAAAARAIAKTCGHSPSQLFFCLAATASCMTVLIPDDVVTMTLAPTICLLGKSLQIDVEPQLYAQFYCANIFAVTLITGNITNVLIAGVTDDGFISFSSIMMLPGLVAGVCSTLLLYVIFRPQLQNPADASLLKNLQEEDGAVRYKMRSFVCLTRLGLAFAFAAFDAVHHWPIWLTIAVFAIISACIDVGLDAMKVDGSSTHTKEVMGCLPFELFLFFPALFILAQQLVHAGLVDAIAQNLVSISESPASAMALVGFASMWAAQAVSTAPMTIIFLQVIMHVPGWRNPVAGTNAQIARDLSLYALVLGSNFCGNITRMGTLGGQMWFRISRSYGIHLDHGLMVWRSLLIMTPVMTLALATLYHGYLARA